MNNVEFEIIWSDVESTEDGAFPGGEKRPEAEEGIHIRHPMDFVANAILRGVRNILDSGNWFQNAGHVRRCVHARLRIVENLEDVSLSFSDDLVGGFRRDWERHLEG